jgi:hypothetical protein
MGSATPVSILLAGAMIAAAILFVFRWEVSGTLPVNRIDRWTGNVVQCNATNQMRLAADALGVRTL